MRKARIGDASHRDNGQYDDRRFEKDTSLTPALLIDKWLAGA